MYCRHEKRSHLSLSKKCFQFSSLIFILHLCYRKLKAYEINLSIMANNYAEFNLIKWVGTADLSSVKQLHYRLVQANWIHQNVFHQTIFNVINESFRGITTQACRRYSSVSILY